MIIISTKLRGFKIRFGDLSIAQVFLDLHGVWIGITFLSIVEDAFFY